ncbi:MAG TPA: phage holin family protein [Lacunisphaera sp.]|nr:phage holin family protein [Lacunisphaera sp.]
MSFPGTSEPRPRVPPIGEVHTLLGEALSHRSALAGIELVEARTHAVTSALLLGAAALFAFLGGLALTLVFAGLVWDSPHRGWWLAGLGIAYFVTAAIVARLLRRRLTIWRPFAATRHQLQLDHQCLTQLIQAILP